MKGLVSKETVVLRRWGSSIQKFGFINGVDNVNWPPYRDSKRVNPYPAGLVSGWVTKNIYPVVKQKH